MTKKELGVTAHPCLPEARKCRGTPHVSAEGPLASARGDKKKGLGATKKGLGVTKNRLRVTHKGLLKLFKTAPIFNKVEKIRKCLQRKKIKRKL